MVETYEDDLTQWYWHHQKENLTNWLCIERVLDPGEEGENFVHICCFMRVWSCEGVWHRGWGSCTLVSDWFLGPCRVVYHLLLTKVAVTVLVTSLR